VKILNRYVLREHAGPLSFAVAALTSLLLLNYIAKNIGQLVGKGLPWSVIAEFILLSVPFTIAMTLPMAILVAVLYAFSRLAAENEITALKASGVSFARVMIPVVLGATVLTLFMIVFNDEVLPRANHRLRTLQGDIARKKPTFALRPRVLNEVSPGKLFLVANHLDPGSNRMREVVIYDLGDPTRERTIYADSGTMSLVPETGDLAMVLYDGTMNDIKKADLPELQRLYYKVDHIRVRGVGDQLTRSTHDDYKSEREMSICEMQSDVGDGVRGRAEAQAMARTALIGAVRTAALGAPPLRPEAQPKLPASATTPPPGLARGYCALKTAVLRLAGHDPNRRIDSGGPGHPRSTPTAPPTPVTAARTTPAPTQGPSTTAKGLLGHPATGTPAIGDTARRGVAVTVAHPPSGPPPSAEQRALQIARTGSPDPTAKYYSATPPALAAGATPAAAQATVGAAASAAAAASAVARLGDVPQVPPRTAAATRPPASPPPGQHRPLLPRFHAASSAARAPGPLPPRVQFIPPSPSAVALQALTNTVESANVRADESIRSIALYDVEIQKKFAIAVACVIFVFLGAPIALRFPRGGVGMVIGVSLGVFALYYVGLIAGEPLGQRGTLSPFLAMWSSNIVFSIIGLILMLQIGREGSTARGGDWGEMKDAMRRRWRARFGARRAAPAIPQVERA